MPLINWKVELKRKWTKFFFLIFCCCCCCCCCCFVGSNDNFINDNNNADNIIFTIKDTKLYVLVVTLSARDNQKFSNFLTKDLKDQIQIFCGIKLCWSK